MFSEYFQRLIGHIDPLLGDVFKVYVRGPYCFCTYTLRKNRGKREAGDTLEKIKKFLGNCKQIISLLFQNKQVDAEEGSCMILLALFYFLRRQKAWFLKNIWNIEYFLQICNSALVKEIQHDTFYCPKTPFPKLCSLEHSSVEMFQGQNHSLIDS